MRELIISSKRIAILTHANADPDAIASSCALTYILKTLNKNALINIVIPEGIGAESRGLAETCIKNDINILVFSKKVVEGVLDHDMLCFLVDTASLEQLKVLKGYLNLCKHFVVIDHHEAHDIRPSLATMNPEKEVVEIVCPNASSTAEVVFEISKHLEVALTEVLLELLVSGIIWDTKRFLRASASTFKCVSEMLEQGADYYKAQQLVTTSKPVYARIAKIKCILRHRGFKMLLPSGDEVYIALSKVGAYESECASALVSIGYDVAFVASEEEVVNAIRIIYRIRDGCAIMQGFDLYSEVLRKVIHRYGGGGGGHRTAGGAIVNTSDAELVLKEIIEALGRTFNGRIVELVEYKVFER